MSNKDNFNYSLVKNDEGTFVVRSTVQSFNLDHVTDKDIVSFYRSFSETASFDTGLLPLNGTGVLAIRSAGFQTQIVTQHAAGLYYVNWGSYEGDRNARTYFVAQPYRIVIGDFEYGNLLGARMFYSPYPITSPNNILYHVNLPNINCKGYKGNGVGWICLYHKDDWSSLPFNEKVIRFIERCSGVETYNDQNMSETDGPRFYEQHSKPSYFTNPSLWQTKSESGYDWVLDPDLLIPVLVKDMDNQDRHYDGGQPLTLAMAMLGNYQAYYSDTNIPKIYNVISRSDMNLDNNHISEFVKRSFAQAPVSYIHTEKDNPYDFTVNQRQNKGSSVFVQPSISSDDEEDENSWTCYDCEDSFSEDDSSYTVAHGNDVCETCFNEHYIYIASTEQHFHYDDSDLIYIDSENEYFHIVYDTVISCDACGTNFATSGKSSESVHHVTKQLYPNRDCSALYCSDCFNEIIDEDELSTSNCISCSKKIVTSTGWSHIYPTVKAVTPQADSTMAMSYVSFCDHCYKDYLICPCGLIRSKTEPFANCTPTEITSSDQTLTSTVTKCCSGCLGEVTIDENGEGQAFYKPFDQSICHDYQKPDSAFVSSVSFVNFKFKADDIF